MIVTMKRLYHGLPASSTPHRPVDSHSHPPLSSLSPGSFRDRENEFSYTIEIIGPLPGELKQTIVYGATVFTGSTQREGNQAFVDFMRSEEARKVLRHTGLDPV